QYKKTLELPSTLWVSSALHGLRMDISFAGYILLLPTLLLMFTAKKWNWYAKALSIFSFIVAFIIVLLVVTDLELFKAWGFRIDGTSLHYLATPTEAFASMGAAPVFLLLLLLVVLFYLVWKLLKTVIARSLSAFHQTGFI